MKFFQRTVLEPAYQGAQLHPGKLSGIYQNEILCNSLFHHYKQRTLKLGRAGITAEAPLSPGPYGLAWYCFREYNPAFTCKLYSH